MSKTCPLSTAVEFKARACALLDVFHTVVGKRTRSVIATTISRVPLANPGHGHLLQDVSTGWQRMPHRFRHQPNGTPFFWPISQFLVFPGHRLIFYRFTPSSARCCRRSCAVFPHHGSYPRRPLH